VDTFSQRLIEGQYMESENPIIIDGELQIQQHENHAKIVVLDKVNIIFLN
jgi:hypothetical protein